MDPTELFHAVRNKFLDHFRQGIDELKQEHGREVVSEMTVRDGEGKMLRKGPFRLPSKLDLCVPNADKTFNVQTRTRVKFKTLRYRPPLSPVEVEVLPFDWQQFVIEGLPRVSGKQHKPLVDWFSTWFEEASGNAEAVGTIHSLEGPSKKENCNRFRIDMGTAPVEALDDLIRALGECGYQALRILPRETVQQPQPQQQQS